MSKVESLLALLLCLSPGLSWASPTSGQVDSPGVYSNDIVLPNPEGHDLLGVDVPNPEGQDLLGVDVPKQQESQGIDRANSNESGHVEGQKLDMNTDKAADILGACRRPSCYLHGMTLLENLFPFERPVFEYSISLCNVGHPSSDDTFNCLKGELKDLKGMELGPMSVSQLGQFIKTVCGNNERDYSRAGCYRDAISHSWVPSKIQESVLDQLGIEVPKQQESQGSDGESSNESSDVEGQKLDMDGNKIADILVACQNYPCYAHGMALLKQLIPNKNERLEHYTLACDLRSTSGRAFDCYRQNLKYLKGIELGQMSVSQLVQFLRTSCDSSFTKASAVACYRDAIIHSWVPAKIQESVLLCENTYSCYAKLLSLVK